MPKLSIHSYRPKVASDSRILSLAEHNPDFEVEVGAVDVAQSTRLRFFKEFRRFVVRGKAT
jgi:hypothetical protein